MESNFPKSKESYPLLSNKSNKLIDNNKSIDNKKINLNNNIIELIVDQKNIKKFYGKLEIETETEEKDNEKEKDYYRTISLDIDKSAKNTISSNNNNIKDRKGNIKNTRNIYYNTISENDKLILNDNKFTIISDFDKDKDKYKTNEAESIKNRVKFNYLKNDFKKNNNEESVKNKLRRMSTINNSISELKSLTKRQLKKVSKINLEKNQLDKMDDNNGKDSDKFFFKKNKSLKNFDTISSKSNKQNNKKNKKSFNHVNDYYFKFNEISPINLNKNISPNYTKNEIEEIFRNKFQILYNKNNLFNPNIENEIKNEFENEENFNLNHKFKFEFLENNKIDDEKNELIEDEKKKLFLRSKDSRKINFNNFNTINSSNKLNNIGNLNEEEYYDEKNNISIDDLIKDNKKNQILDVSENSLFYNNEYFKNRFKNYEESNKLKHSNKDEQILKRKLMYYYLNPRKNSAMPKFSKISIKDKKCNEIMDYKTANDEEITRQFYDEYPCFKFRKFIFNVTERLKKYFLFVKSPIFDNLSLLIIIINTIFILYSDPLDPTNIANSSEMYFLYLFTIEMVLKILALGLILPADSYFRDIWNIIDFLVVSIGWISFLLEITTSAEKISGLNSLRAFRILRPLKTIKSIKGLRRIISTLLESMLALGDIILVLLFFFLIFAIAGIQCWQGLFLLRCHSKIYGYPLPINDYRNMCSTDDDCKIFNSYGEKFFCVATNQNPNFNTTHFDSLLSAMTTVFMITTMEGWTDIFKYVSKTFKNDYYINTIIIAIYFFSIMFVGGYYLINLYLAVINYTYCEIEIKNKKRTKKENLSLHGILMETFLKTVEEENENLSEIEYDEIKFEEKEEILNKIKEECKLFNYNLDKYTISYEGIKDIRKIRNYKPKELFELKKQIIVESKFALEEYENKIKFRKKIGTKNKEISNKENDNDNNNNDSNNNMNNNFNDNNRGRHLILTNKKISYTKFNFNNNLEKKFALEEIIPKSIKKTKESYRKELEKGNIEIEKKDLRKKSILKVKKRKINEILNKDILENTEENINLSSDDESLIEVKTNKNNNNKYSNNSFKKYSNKNLLKKNSNFTLNNKKETDDKRKSDISNKNTNFNDDDKKCDYVQDLTFSINTSDDSSSFGYINETVNENNNNTYKKEKEKNKLKDKDKEIINNSKNKDEINNDKDRSPNNFFRNSKNEVDKEQYFTFVEYAKRKFEEDINKDAINNSNYINNIENIIEKEDNIKNKDTDNKKNIINKENLITKKTLFEIDYNLCNKMIINKPNNPLISVPKHKEEIIFKKKIKDFQEDFKFNEIFNEKDQIILIKKQKNKDQKFLNFLKNTEETTRKFQQITIEEMRKYEDFLEDQESLEISKVENENKLLIIDSEENINDSLMTQNEKKENDEIERMEEIIILEKRINAWENKKNTIKRMLTHDKNSDRKSTFSTFDIMVKTKKFDFKDKDLNFNSLNTNENLNSNNTNNKKTISSNFSKSKSKIAKEKKDNKKTNKNENNNIDKKNTFYYDDIIIKEKIKLINDTKINKYLKSNSKNYVKKRTLSIKSNKIKFSNLTIKFENEKNKKDNDDESNKSFISNKGKEKLNIKNNLNSYRNYMKYLNFTLNKDYKIKDKFNVDYFQADVMGKSEYIETKINNDNNLDPIKIFNKKNLNLKNVFYVKYLKTPIEILKKDEIKNNLKYLSDNIINSMYNKTKNFRNLREKIKKNSLNIIHITGNTISESAIKEFKSLIRKTSSIHRSNFIIGNTLKEIKKNTLIEIEQEKKKNREVLFNDFIELSLKNKTDLFFEFDKIFIDNMKKKEDSQNQISAKIEIDTNWEQDDKKLKIEEIRNFDFKTNSIKYNEWSGYHVMNWQKDQRKFKEWNSLLEKIEKVNIIIWEKEFLCFYIIKRIRYILLKLSTNKLFEYFVLLIVFLNMIQMLLEGNLIQPEYNYIINNLNLGFNSFFIFEFVIKFLGLGPIIYFSDGFTYLDLMIISLAVLDISSNSSVDEKNLSSKFEFLRILRIFRVLRIAKILRKLKSFRKISRGISNSLNNVAYNSLILFIFIVIFQLLGVTFFSQSENYRGFLSSFYVTFQLLTLENWNAILFELNKFNNLSVIYLIALIFIGNYILFNLFISILLNSFDSLSDTNIDEEDEFIKSLPEEFRKYEKQKKEIYLKKRQDKLSKKDNKKNKNEIGVNFINYKSSSSDEDSFEKEEEEEDQNEINKDKIMLLSIISSTGEVRKVKKFMKGRKFANEVFCENECEYSLFIFSQTSVFRIFCKNIIKLKRFDKFILLMILLSTLRLILDTFIAGALASKIFDFLDITFTSIFLIEMIIKIIALGFVLEEGSYLRDNWNRLDFTIVLFSIIDLQYFIEKYNNSLDINEIGTSLNFLRVLRLLRTLRPLRFISHNVQLKIIIISLFDSLDAIQNVLVIVFIVILTFSIIGMKLFYNEYHTCYTYINNDNQNKFVPIVNFNEFIDFNKTNSIMDSIMINKICNDKKGIFDAAPSFKFSNIFTSLITAYVLSNGEGWSEIMNYYRSYSEPYGLFFVIFYLVVTNFFFNLFVGVMFSSFNEAWNKEHKKEITENSKIEQYWDFLKQIDIVDPEFSQFYAHKEKEGFRKKISDIVTSKYFENFIISIIVANMITMGLDYQGSSENFRNNLDIFNLLFSVIFILESFFKILALGIKDYFYLGWNKFDFFVVIASLLDILFKYTNTNVYFLKSFQIIRVLRVLRVTRVLRLVKSLRGLEKLLQTLRWSLNALMNVLILMLLVFCIFSIIGCYLFGDLSVEKYQKKFSYYNEYFNFTNFYYSFLLTFRSVTGENWNLIMIEIAEADPINYSPIISYFYFIIMTFITYVIMLNLFLLVTLQQFEDFSRKETNPIEKFAELLKKFKEAWNKHSNYNDKGFRIKCTKLTEFFKEFDSDLIKKKIKKLDYLKKYILDLELLNDEDDYVYFQDVLYKMIKSEFGKTIDRKKNKLIVRLEEKLLKSIKIKIDFFLKNNNKGNIRTINVLNTFNPLTSHLYYKHSFNYIKCFLKKYIETQEQIRFANVTGYNEEDVRFVNNLHLSRINKKRESIIYDYQQGLNNEILNNFNEYNNILELNQKKSRREIKNENLPNLSEENLIDGEISNSNNKINDSENIDNSKIKSYYSIDSEKK